MPKSYTVALDGKIIPDDNDFKKCVYMSAVVLMIEEKILKIFCQNILIVMFT